MNQSLCLIAGVAATVLASIYSTAVGQPAAGAPAPFTPAAPLKPVPNRPPLAATPFLPLPIGQVKPEGWLLRQLQLQKAGLTGASEQIYDALTPDSGWLGGKGENWEKGPYYIRGLIALAWTLDDAELKQRSQKWVDWALQSQRDDGFFGPNQNDDWWPRMVVLWYLRDYYEATQDPRVIPFFTKYFRHQLANLPGRPLRDWGRSRAGDNIDIVLWTYNQTGDAALLDLAKLLYDQAYPWQSIFTLGRYNDFGEDFQPKHIVNVSQALKFPAVAWQFTHSDADFDSYFAGVNNLDKRYGRLDGQVSGTEMLSGRASTDGVELCADIERIMSDGIAVTTFGDAAIGDRLERVAFNSLPAHTSPRMQQITYYQLMNQVTATPGGHGFQQDYGNGNMPGPHSGFPCCCYNWHAGWPKYVQQMWAATNDGGLAAIAYGPNHLSTIVGDNVPVTVTQTTDYPFAESISLKVEPKQAVTFPLVLRIPGWCDDAEVSVNGLRTDNIALKRSFIRIDREWKAGDVVTLKFPMKVRASTWVNNSVGLERGPLTFALRIKEDWKKKTELMNDFDEYEVHPQSAWNYALDLNEDDISKIEVKTAAVPEVPFSTEHPAVTLTIPAKKVPEWGLRPQPAARVVFGRADRNWTQVAEADAINTSAAAANAAGRDAAAKAGNTHAVRIDTRGPRLRVYVDDMTKPVMVQRDATFPVGGIGLRAYEAAATFTNIRLNGQPVSNAQDAFKFLGGEWTSQNGELKTTPARDAKAFYIPANNLRDLTFEATVTTEGNGNAGLLIHSTPLGQELDAYKGYYIGLSAGRKLSQDAAEPPTSPVKTNSPTEQVELIPFGSGKLRVTYFPVTQ